MPRRLIQSIIPRFSECNEKGNVHFATVYRYMEEARFHVAHQIRLRELLMERYPNIESSFLVVNIKTEYFERIPRSERITLETILLPTEYAKIQFEHNIYIGEKHILRALVDNVIVNDMNQVIYQFDDTILEAMNKYMEADDIYL